MNSAAYSHLLQSLSPRERDLVQRVMAQHPKLTLEEALEALKEAGM
jgi:FixJ family two-component response regulator